MRSTERVRLHRQRKRVGEKVIPVNVNYALLRRALADAGMLPQMDSRDAVARKATEFVETIIKENTP